MRVKQPITPERLAELRALPYKEYVKSIEWNRRRIGAILRASRRCQVCNSPDELTVHHRSYAHIGEEPASDLVVLCWPCHKLFHEHRRLVREPLVAASYC